MSVFHNNYLLALLIGSLNLILFIAGLCVFIWAALDSRRERSTGGSAKLSGTAGGRHRRSNTVS